MPLYVRSYVRPVTFPTPYIRPTSGNLELRTSQAVVATLEHICQLHDAGSYASMEGNETLADELYNRQLNLEIRLEKIYAINVRMKGQ
jgi:hypothetical protein